MDPTAGYPETLDLKASDRSSEPAMETDDSSPVIGTQETVAKTVASVTHQHKTGNPTNVCALQALVTKALNELSCNCHSILFLHCH